MPRDGSEVYSVPPGTQGVSGATIESAKYNAFLQDITNDLNAARPISAGGTGGTSAPEARDELGLEIGVDIPSFVPLYNFLRGLTISNNVADAVNDIDTAPGACMDSTNMSMIVHPAAMSKRLDAVWAAGTGNGGRLSGASINDITYHYYAIKNPTNGAVDYGFSSNPTDPRGGANYPAAYTLYRRIGSIIRASGAIILFKQDGDTFTFDEAKFLQASGLTTSAVLYTAQVPQGLRLLARVGLSLASTTLNTFFYGLITAPDQTDTVPAVGNCDLALKTPGAAGTYVESTSKDVFTNTSGQVRARVSNGDTNCTLTLTTFGWIDHRGRD